MHQAMAEKPTKTRLQEQIDENLKRVYDDALNEEVPDRFKILLERLKQKDRER
jgi:hypothetical protein